MRYCAQPPLSLERLHALGRTAPLASPDARPFYRLPKPDPPDRTELLLSPLDAARARRAPPAASPHPPPPLSRPPRSARIRWAQLLARIYEVLPLLCPRCGGEMRILAFLTDPPTVQAILLHLKLPHPPPPVAPARGPPQVELLLDQTPALDLADPESVPDFNFDQ